MRMKLQSSVEWVISLVPCVLGAVWIGMGIWQHSWLWGLLGFFVGSTGGGLMVYVMDHPTFLTLTDSDFTFTGDFRPVSVRWEDLRAIERKIISYGRGSAELLIIRWTDGERERKQEFWFGPFLTDEVVRTLRRWWREPELRKRPTSAGR